MPYFVDADEYFGPSEGVILHYGVLMRSGRYPWGSGEDPYQRLKGTQAFLHRVNELKKSGKTEAEVAQLEGFKNTEELRNEIAIAKHEKRKEESRRVLNYKDKGWSDKAVAEKLGISESQVRNYQKPNAIANAIKFDNAHQMLAEQVMRTGYLDVSKGIESQMKITEDMKEKVLHSLRKEGYVTHVIREKQAYGESIPVTVLAKEGTTWKDVLNNRDKIVSFYGEVDAKARIEREKSGLSDYGLLDPISIDPKRLAIKYGEDGGGERDGVMYIRPGAKDLDMGGNQYAQVRIKVGDSHYLKGMAVLSDDIPKGADILFHTPKAKTDNKLDVLKPLKNSEDNPFGAVVKQLTTEDGKKLTSAINIVNSDESWDTWSKTLASQFLSKQSTKLARTQLELSQANRKAELDEILALENPTIKQHMLQKFADSADASAVHLKAASIPGQKTHVLMPLTSMKPNEVYAPNFKNGDRVVLIRYPHAGPFEIPELVVNNNNKEGAKLLGKNSRNAIGINSKVAEQLSGADFDGDTVVVVPNNSGRIKTQNKLKDLENFDPHTRYALPKLKEEEAAKDPRYLKKASVGTEMGKITNLIGDMQLQGANPDEVARAVKHSMVVIDAYKHQLDYKTSAIDNDISGLKAKYQKDGGAATLITRASSKQGLPEMRVARYKNNEGGPVDPETGELRYVPTNRTKTKWHQQKDGRWVPEETDELVVRREHARMTLVKDAHELSSGTPMEEIYADYANGMKGLANKARLELMATPNLKRDPDARKKYAEEVSSLEDKLILAKTNAPREREAQRLAALKIKAIEDENPQMDKDDLKKAKAQALRTARDRTGASKNRIVPTDKEWEAIQAGAISHTKLKEILANGDQEAIVKLATPKDQKTLRKSQISLIKSMAASGYTQAEIAERLGVSPTTVNGYL